MDDPKITLTSDGSTLSSYWNPITGPGTYVPPIVSGPTSFTVSTAVGQPQVVELSPQTMQAIREIVREELAKQLQDDDDDVPISGVHVRAPLDGFPSMTVEFMHDGMIYKGTAYVVEVDE